MSVVVGLLRGLGNVSVGIVHSYGLSGYSSGILCPGLLLRLLGLLLLLIGSLGLGHIGSFCCYDSLGCSGGSYGGLCSCGGHQLGTYLLGELLLGGLYSVKAVALLICEKDIAYHVLGVFTAFDNACKGDLWIVCGSEADEE